MNDLVPRMENLPSKVEDLSKWILIGKVKLKARIAAIKAISKLDEGVAACAAALSDTQDLAEELLYAEAHLGGLWEQIPSESGKRTDKPGNSEVTRLQSTGATKRVRQNARALDRNQDKIAEVVAEAREKGEVPVRQHVLRQVAKSKQKEKVQAIRDKEVAGPVGLYDVIVIDPPWPLQKVELECRPNQVAQVDYPTMTEDELNELEIPADKDCHLWLWTTHRFLPMAFRLVDQWGLKYVCTFVWHKPGGYGSLIGLPQYNCEFALYLRKGSPSFVDLKAFKVCFDAPRQKHSQKPQVFYDVVRRVTCGNRLDMFSRRKIAGFKTWGLEA